MVNKLHKNYVYVYKRAAFRYPSTPSDGIETIVAPLDHPPRGLNVPAWDRTAWMEPARMSRWWANEAEEIVNALLLVKRNGCCPDDGKCWHGCAEGARCWRVDHAGSMVGDSWVDTARRNHAAIEGLTT